MTERQYLFACWDGGGNLPPMLALARQMASQEGTRVTVLGPESMRAKVESRGATLHPVTGLALALAESDITDDMDGFIQYLAGEAGAREILGVIDEVSPDATVVDCMYFAALAAAEKADVARAAFIHMRYGFFTEDAREPINNWLGPSVNATRASLGLAAFDIESGSVARQAWDSASSALSMLAPDLESALEQDPRQLIHVGPIFDAPAGPREDGEPLILVSFSTTQMKQGLALQNVLDAVAGLDARVVCTTAGVDVGDLRAPDNTEVLSWIDHAEVLPRTSVVVTHAGMGTTLAALAHGVPIVAMPMGRDQDGNAARIAELGAGVHLAPTAPVDEIATAVRAALAGDDFVKSARRLSRDIRQFDNGALAVSSLGWM